MSFFNISDSEIQSLSPKMNFDNFAVPLQPVVVAPVPESIVGFSQSTMMNQNLETASSTKDEQCQETLQNDTELEFWIPANGTNGTMDFSYWADQPMTVPEPIADNDPGIDEMHINDSTVPNHVAAVATESIIEYSYSPILEQNMETLPRNAEKLQDIFENNTGIGEMPLNDWAVPIQTTADITKSIIESHHSPILEHNMETRPVNDAKWPDTLHNFPGMDEMPLNDLIVPNQTAAEVSELIVESHHHHSPILEHNMETRPANDEKWPDTLHSVPGMDEMPLNDWTVPNQTAAEVSELIVESHHSPIFEHNMETRTANDAKWPDTLHNVPGIDEMPLNDLIVPNQTAAEVSELIVESHHHHSPILEHNMETRPANDEKWPDTLHSVPGMDEMPLNDSIVHNQTAAVVTESVIESNESPILKQNIEARPTNEEKWHGNLQSNIEIPFKNLAATDLPGPVQESIIVELSSPEFCLETRLKNSDQSKDALKNDPEINVSFNKYAVHNLSVVTSESMAESNSPMQNLEIRSTNAEKYQDQDTSKSNPHPEVKAVPHSPESKSPLLRQNMESCHTNEEEKLQADLLHIEEVGIPSNNRAVPQVRLLALQPIDITESIIIESNHSTILEQNVEARPSNKEKLQDNLHITPDVETETVAHQPGSLPESIVESSLSNQNLETLLTNSEQFQDILSNGTEVESSFNNWAVPHPPRPVPESIVKSSSPKQDLETRTRLTNSDKFQDTLKNDLEIDASFNNWAVPHPPPLVPASSSQKKWAVPHAPVSVPQSNSPLLKQNMETRPSPTNDEKLPDTLHKNRADIPFNDWAVPLQPVVVTGTMIESNHLPMLKQNTETCAANDEKDQDTLHNDTEAWMSGNDFCNAGNASEWDDLMSRGNGAPTVNRWERNSLYQRFDPLVERRASMMPKPKTPVRKLPVHNESVDEGGMYSGDTFYTAKENQSNLSGFTPTSGTNSNSPSPQKFIEEDTNELKLCITLNESTSSISKAFEALSLEVSVDEPTENSQNSHECINDELPLDEIEKNASGTEDNEDIVLQTKMDEMHIQCIDSLNENLSNLEEEKSRLKTVEENAKLDALKKRSEDQEKESLKIRLNETLKSTDLIKLQRQEALSDLNAVEEAFTGVLLSYEGGKAYQKHFDINQKVLEERVILLTNASARRQEKLDHMQKKVDETMERFQRDVAEKLKEVENENRKLRAKLKMTEMTSQKLESEIEQTVIETAKLRALCDEMIQT